MIFSLKVALSKIRLRKKTNDSAEIAEILGLMEENGLGKVWLLEKIKNQRIKIKVSPTANSYEILKTCPKYFKTDLLRDLQEEDFSFELPEKLTKTYHWFFTDIVASSDPTISTKTQLRKIMFLIGQIKRAKSFKQSSPDSTYILPTGDGMAIGFSDSPEKPLRLAIELHKAQTQYNKTRSGNNKLNIRIGIDTGPVYLIKDLAGNDNVWGPGIIWARRVMDLGEQNHILASERIAGDVRKLSSEYKAIIRPIGKYLVKHDEEVTIYNVFGKGFGNRLKPNPKKLVREDDIVTSPFIFNSIKIILQITNPKTMLTHHTLIWNIKNITKKPLEQIFYPIGGDVARKFDKLNVTVKDEKNNKLEIVDLTVNRPYEKEFKVKIKNPIKYGQKGRILKLEYDWEEPERTFDYTLAAACKTFKYYFSIPTGVEIKRRVLEVNRNLGIMKHPKKAPEMKIQKNKTVITWNTKNLKAHDSFRFVW